MKKQVKYISAGMLAGMLLCGGQMQAANTMSGMHVCVTDAIQKDNRPEVSKRLFRSNAVEKEIIRVQKLLKNREFKVAVSITVILLVYIKGLIPFFRKTIDFFPKFQAFPFMIATFIMLFVMMIAFSERTKKHVVTSLIVSAVSAAAISYGFGMLALIPLP